MYAQACAPRLRGSGVGIGQGRTACMYMNRVTVSTAVRLCAYLRLRAVPGEGKHTTVVCLPTPGAGQYGCVLFVCVSDFWFDPLQLYSPLAETATDFHFQSPEDQTVQGGMQGDERRHVLYSCTVHSTAVHAYAYAYSTHERYSLVPLFSSHF